MRPLSEAVRRECAPGDTGYGGMIGAAKRPDAQHITRYGTTDRAHEVRRGPAIHRSSLPGLTPTAGRALQIHEDVPARDVPIHASVAARAPAANLVGAATLKAEGQPIGAKERFIGPETAIDRNATRMIWHHDHGRHAILRNCWGAQAGRYCCSREKEFETKAFHEVPPRSGRPLSRQSYRKHGAFDVHGVPRLYSMSLFANRRATTLFCRQFRD